MQAGLQATLVRADVAGRVALRQEVAARLLRAAVRLDLAPRVAAADLACAIRHVLEEAGALAEGLAAGAKVLRALVRLHLHARGERSDAAPTGATRYEGAHWRKRHVGWTDNQAKGGADRHDDFTAEGKVAVPNPNPSQMLPRTQTLS